MVTSSVCDTRCLSWPVSAGDLAENEREASREGGDRLLGRPFPRVGDLGQVDNPSGGLPWANLAKAERCSSAVQTPRDDEGALP